jgi:hypothetical protein
MGVADAGLAEPAGTFEATRAAVPHKPSGAFAAAVPKRRPLSLSDRTDGAYRRG